jgi:hypothetical protein
MTEIEPAIAVEGLAKIYQRAMAVAGISFVLPVGLTAGCPAATAPARPPPRRSWG